MNIAVVDAGGNLKAFARMDDAFWAAYDIAERKARTARYLDLPTRALGNTAQPGQPLTGIESHQRRLGYSSAGGVSLLDKKGTIVGSVGVSGGSVDETKMWPTPVPQLYCANRQMAKFV